MALFEITDAASSVVDVAFSKDHSTMAVLHQTGVNFYAWQTKGARTLAPKLIGQVEFEETERRLFERPVFQICFSEGEAAHVLYGGEGPQISLCRPGMTEKLDLEGLEQNEILSFVTSASEDSTAIGQSRTGQLFRKSNEEQETLPIKFPFQLPWAEVVSYGESYVAFGLSRSGHLYANSRLLTKNCTSFVVTRDHLILTTSNHFLKFVHLDDVEGKY